MDGIHSISPGGHAFHPQSLSTPPLHPSPGDFNSTQQNSASLKKAEILQMGQDLQKIVSAVNKRMEFRYHEDLGQVVVKIVDRDTDKVIKELPSAELQQAHLRIRQALGLLIDEEA